MPIIGTDKVLNDLDRFGRELVDSEDIPYELKTSVVTEIVRTGSIDTTRMIQAVNYHREVVSDGAGWRIDTSDNTEVTYDGFVERPGETRRWPGRFFYKQGIENANIGRAVDAIAERSFVI